MFSIISNVFSKRKKNDCSQPIDPDEINYITYRKNGRNGRVVRTTVKKYKELFNLY